jgi:hypothetical protein
VTIRDGKVDIALPASLPPAAVASVPTQRCRLADDGAAGAEVERAAVYT